MDQMAVQCAYNLQFNKAVGGQFLLKKSTLLPAFHAGKVQA
jgi:hypothetical protein